ncbi:hypothetical protein [Nonomuraea maritima]|uniref:hypothetical protein n=1 Tax=Nonomuraea maritima TaxID=683260 RepID=UPI003720AA43
MRNDWHTPVGDLLTRDERMALYGGAKYGGIEPSSKTDNVFIYSGLAAVMPTATTSTAGTRTFRFSFIRETGVLLINGCATAISQLPGTRLSRGSFESLSPMR